MKRISIGIQNLVTMVVSELSFNSPSNKKSDIDKMTGTLLNY